MALLVSSCGDGAIGGSDPGSGAAGGGSDAGGAGGSGGSSGGAGAGALGGNGGQGGSPCATQPGLAADGTCAALCGAAPACDGKDPGELLAGCQLAGNASVLDRCSDACLVEDEGAMTCRALGEADCQGAPECDGVAAGSESCDGACQPLHPCDGTSGWIRASIDGITIFDYSTARSLTCLDLAYDPGSQYGAGPPGAQVIATTVQPGLLEASLVGFADSHQNCLEKWGFVILTGDCVDVQLQKWNIDPCGGYYTCALKLETWVDTDGDCTYAASENTEPYGGCISWDPAHTYQLRVEWQ